MQIPAVRAVFGSYRVAVETVAIVAVLVAIRAVIWNLGITGMSTTPLASSIIGGGVFVMGLVVAGTLSDYRDAERAPTDIAASLYALLREAEAMNNVWGKPDLAVLRNRLIAVVTSLRSDINAGNTRDCQEAVEDMSASLLELEESDVPGQLHRPAAGRTGGVAQGHPAHVPHSARGVPAVGEGDDHQPGGDHPGHADVHRHGWAAGVAGHPGFPGVLLRLPAADHQRHRQAVQGRQGTDRRRCKSFPAH